MYNKPNKLLPGNKLDEVNPSTGKYLLEWCGTDSATAFKKNLATQPNDWYYRNKKIIYNFNSNGYRAPEWEYVDWANSVVIFGCSHVTGIGLAEDETISYYMSKILNRPVINLGVAKTGITFSLHNSILLRKNFPMPWGVVQLWSATARIHEYRKNYIMHYGAWDKENEGYMKHWAMHDDNVSNTAYFAKEASSMIWKKKTRYYSASMFEDTAAILECDYIARDSLARDLIHPGKDCTLLAAEHISTGLLNDSV